MIKAAKDRGFADGSSSIGWFSIETDPLRSGRLRRVNSANLINDFRGGYILNGGKVTTQGCGGERVVFARFQSGCEC